MSVVIAKYKITGMSSILMNNPASMRHPDDSVKVKKIPTPEDEAASKVYRQKNGNLHAPAFWFRASLLAGAVSRKIGKLSAKKALSAGVFCVAGEDECTLLHVKNNKPIREYKINVMRAVVKTAGVMRARPEVEGWACILVLEIDTDFVTPEQVESLLNIAGKIAGVGDYRGGCEGTFGRYKAELLNKAA